MQALHKALAPLSSEWQRAVLAQPTHLLQTVQDIRVRCGAPLSLSLPHRELFPRDGQGRTLLCTDTEIQRLLARLCEHSVYAHSDELRRGFITTAQGMRVGVAATAVLNENGAVSAVRDVTSLCLRVWRVHRDCARPLLPYLSVDGRLHSLLLCAPPSGGKTSLLRDTARLLGNAGYRVSVVDSRGELSAGDTLSHCDVLRMYPQTQGLLQAIRTLSPDVVVLDEVGGRDQTQALLQCTYTGVAVIASVHASCARQLYARDEIRRAVRDGAFDYIAFLYGRHRPGEIRQIVSGEEWLREMDGTVDGIADGDRRRDDGGTPPARQSACA